MPTYGAWRRWHSESRTELDLEEFQAVSIAALPELVTSSTPGSQFQVDPKAHVRKPKRLKPKTERFQELRCCIESFTPHGETT